MIWRSVYWAVAEPRRGEPAVGNANQEVSVKKFLVLYRSDEDAAARMAASTPEQQEAGMQLWMEWFGRAGSAIVDGGAPLTGGDGAVSGYSIVQAESSEALADVLDGHPHTTHGGGTIETYEFLPVPGM
jgi:hypothetical protein